jgi:hypothetical protein
MAHGDAECKVQVPYGQSTEEKSEEAKVLFEHARALDTGLQLEPLELSKTIAALALVDKGTMLASQGDILQALTIFEKAQVLAPIQTIEAQDWKKLCWYGSLSEHVAPDNGPPHGPSGKVTDRVFGGIATVSEAPDVAGRQLLGGEIQDISSQLTSGTIWHLERVGLRGFEIDFEAEARRAAQLPTIRSML